MQTLPYAVDSSWHSATPNSVDRCAGLTPNPPTQSRQVLRGPEARGVVFFQRDVTTCDRLIVTCAGQGGRWGDLRDLVGVRTGPHTLIMTNITW